MPRMFGYSSGQPTTKSHFGSVPSTFAMDDVSCFGNETSLLDCPHVTVDNCGSHEAAGVICSNSGPIESNWIRCLRFWWRTIHWTNFCQSNILLNTHIWKWQVLFSLHEKSSAVLYKICTFTYQTSSQPFWFRKRNRNNSWLGLLHKQRSLHTRARRLRWRRWMCRAPPLWGRQLQALLDSGWGACRLLRPRFLFFLAVFSFDLAEVKLVGGSGPHEGNIFVGGKPVCDDDHDVKNALVVCRYLVVSDISREISKTSSSSYRKLSKII